MNAFLNRAKTFVKSEDGPTATEYAVLLGLIIVASLALIGTIGGSVKSIFTKADTAVSTADAAIP